MPILFCTCGKVYTVTDEEASAGYVCRRCFVILTAKPPARSLGGPTRPFGQDPDLKSVLIALQASQPSYRVPIRTATAVVALLGLVLWGWLSERNRAPAGTPVLREAPPAEVLASLEPPTGTAIAPPAPLTGRGQLTLINGTDRWAVVKLCGPGAVASRRPRLYRCVFVASHDSTTLKRIAPGTYEVLFSLGRGWDPQTRRFRERLCARFERPLHFEEKVTRREVRYHTYRLTLHCVAGGNIAAHRISDQEFDEVR